MVEKKRKEELELDETEVSLKVQDTNEEELIKEEIQRFIKMAKDRPSLAIEEINELLPPEIVAASVLDTFMQAHEVNGVVITDSLEKKEDEEEDQFFLTDPDKEAERDSGMGAEGEAAGWFDKEVEDQPGAQERGVQAGAGIENEPAAIDLNFDTGGISADL